MHFLAELFNDVNQSPACLNLVMPVSFIVFTSLNLTEFATRSCSLLSTVFAGILVNELPYCAFITSLSVFNTSFIVSLASGSNAGVPYTLPV